MLHAISTPLASAECLLSSPHQSPTFTPIRRSQARRTSPRDDRWRENSDTKPTERPRTIRIGFSERRSFRSRKQGGLHWSPTVPPQPFHGKERRFAPRKASTPGTHTPRIGTRTSACIGLRSGAPKTERIASPMNSCRSLTGPARRRTVGPGWSAWPDALEGKSSKPSQTRDHARRGESQFGKPRPLPRETKTHQTQPSEECCSSNGAHRPLRKPTSRRPCCTWKPNPHPKRETIQPFGGRRGSMTMPP